MNSPMDWKPRDRISSMGTLSLGMDTRDLVSLRQAQKPNPYITDPTEGSKSQLNLSTEYISLQLQLQLQLFSTYLSRRLLDTSPKTNRPDKKRPSFPTKKNKLTGQDCLVS
ncbi:hypothetical protein OCU04_004782 [Sclerotinia nivalis]|uniref:Uncharacterized protein n=1 Tax=Sclerotinia nivalis TaxID=352851 RepID=A0A9X0AR59_9HELO|nr:hypothetical protein OCU04_004782 [Sclerotinia nivalis]